MATWIRADMQFPMRGAQFSIPLSKLLRATEKHGEALSDVLDSGGCAVMETILRDYILGARPNLVGCTIHAMQLDIATMFFRVLVSHPELPEHAIGETFPALPLLEEPA